MGGFMSVIGLASQAASLVAPYFEREATYRAEEKRLEAESIKTQTQIDNELQKARDQEWKARQTELEAELARNEGKINEAAAAEAAYRAKGQSRARLAQGGILGGATGAAILEEAERNAAGDQFKIQHNTGRQIQGLLSQADNYRNRAGYYRQSASQTAKAAQLGAESRRTASRTGNILNGLQTAGSILGTVSSVYRLFRQDGR